MISSFYTYKETGNYGNWLKTLSSNPIQSDKNVVWTFVQTPVRLRTSPQIIVYVIYTRWRIRLSVRTRDFHSLESGSIPLCATKYTSGNMDLDAVR